MRIPRQLANLYPPFLGAGIRVKSKADFSEIRSEMKLRWWNRNYVGTHFGGSIYTMTDPFYMIMLIEQLGRGYRVWLKEAAIRFLRPGRGTIGADFRLSPETVAELKHRVDLLTRDEIVLPVSVTDERGNVVAEVTQTLHVRRHDDKRANDALAESGDDAARGNHQLAESRLQQSPR
jgi:acyl-coenzyme A thioesterase PaaI-like protein